MREQQSRQEDETIRMGAGKAKEAATTLDLFRDPTSTSSGQDKSRRAPAPMKILWVKVGGLWPLYTGGRIRSFHTISELSRRHHVNVVTTHGPGEDPGELAKQLPWCKQLISVPYTIPRHGSVRFAMALVRSWFSRLPVDSWKCRLPALRNEVSHLTSTANIDVCVADFLYTTPNVPFDAPVP